MAGNIKGITIEINGNTTKLDRALKNVNNTGRDLNNQLKAIDKALKFNPGNAELIAQKQRALASSVENTKEKLNTLREAHRQAQQQLANGEIGQDEFDALTREIIRAENQLNSFERQLHQVNSTAYQMGESMQKFGEKTEKLGKKILPVSLAVGGIGAISVKTAADFESAMSQVSAISGATGEDLNALKEKAKEMGATTKFSASESAEALKYMAMAGWDTEKMLGGLPGIMNLAAASGEELATVSDIVTDAMTAFKLEAKEAGHFADILAVASSKSNTNVALLGESFKFAAPLAGALNFSAEDTAIALGLMANSGIKASQAGTSLRGALTSLANPSKEASSFMYDYNFSLTNADGSMKSLKGVMDNLRSSFGSVATVTQKADGTLKTYEEIMAEAERGTIAFGEAQRLQALTAIFGKNAMSGILAIISASDEDYAKLTESIYNADGASKQMADTMNDNLNGQIILLKSALEGLAIKLGEILLPVIKDLVSNIQGFVDMLNNLSPSAQLAIVAIGGLIAIAGPLLIIIGKMSIGVGALMKAFSMLSATTTATTVATAGAGASASGLSTVLTALAGPIGIVIALITALGIAFVVAYKNNEEFRNKVQEVWKQVQEFIGKAIESIKRLIDGFVKLAKDLWDRHGKEITAIAKAMWDLISTIIKTAIENIKTIVNAFVGAFKWIWQNFGGTITAIAKNTWEGINKVISGVLNIIKGIITAWTALIKGDWNAFGESLKTIAKGIWTAISGIVETALKNLKAIGSKFFSVGKDMILGIIKGVGNTAQQLYDKVASIATNALDTIKKKLGIKSPSRVFAKEVGENISLGTAKGIKDKESAISKALSDVHDRMMKAEELHKEKMKRFEEDKVKESSERLTALGLKEIGERYSKYANLEKQQINTIGLQIAELEKAIEQNKSIERTKANKERLNQQQKILEEEQKLLNQEKKHLEELSGAFEKTFDKMQQDYEKAYSSIESKQTSLYDKLHSFGKLVESFKDGDTEIFKLGDIESQIAMIEQYGQTIERLKSRGADIDVINQVLNMSIEDAVRYGNLLLEQSNEDFEKYMKSMEKKRELSNRVARDAYLSELNLLKNEYAMKMYESMEELPEMLGKVGVDASKSLFEPIVKGGAEQIKIQNEQLEKGTKTANDVWQQHGKDTKTQWQNMNQTALTQFNQIKTSVITPIEQARTRIVQLIKEMENAFRNMKIEIPRPKIPKINVSMRNAGKGIEIPDFDVSWHKQGGIFTRPTIFNTPYGLHGVGEEGAEAVLPLSKLDDIVANAIKKTGAGNAVYNINFNGDMQIRSDEDIRRLARELGEYVLSKNRALGGAY